jgi:hypothetical protein
MNPSNRDLLVLVKDEFDSEQSMQCALQQLNRILFEVETLERICLVNEVADLNKYKLITDAKKLSLVFRQPALKAFQFVINKN